MTDKSLTEGVRTVLGLIAYCLVVYGPGACRNPHTHFGVWCLAGSGDWVYRAERREYLRETKATGAAP